MSNILSVEALQAALPNYLIIDTRFALNDLRYGAEAYAAGHLPGAFFLDLHHDLSGPIQAHGGRHPLPDLNAFVTRLKQLGLTQNQPVVVYDDAEQMFAGRLWWMLRYLGHPKVQVLDGGFPAWVTAGYPVSQDIPSAMLGNFQPQVQKNMWVDMATDKAKLELPAVLLLDARSPERYRGEVEPLDAVAGHIPGALNRPFKANLTSGGRYKSPETLRQEFEALGVGAAEEVIVYCGSGVTANHHLIAIEEAGLPLPQLYLGSWSDWSSYPDNPVATG